MSRLIVILTAWVLAGPACALGTIAVTSDVPAYVELKGEKVGETPLSVPDLDRGTYELTITALATGETKTFRVSIPAEQDVVRSVNVRFGAGAPEPKAKPEKPAKVEKAGVPRPDPKPSAKPRKAKKKPSAKPAPRPVAGTEPPGEDATMQSPAVQRMLAIRRARRAAPAGGPPRAPLAEVAPAPPRSPIAPARVTRRDDDLRREVDRFKRRWRDPYIRRHVISGGAALVGAAASSGILAGLGLGGVIMNEVIHRETDRGDDGTRRL